MIPSGKKSVTRMMKAPEKIGWSSGIQRFASSKTPARIKAPKIGPQRVPVPPKIVMRMGVIAQLRL
jgi:hypothetical protein